MSRTTFLDETRGAGKAYIGRTVASFYCLSLGAPHASFVSPSSLSPIHIYIYIKNTGKGPDGEVVATMSEDDPLHSGVEFSDPEAAIPEQVGREGGREGWGGWVRGGDSDFVILTYACSFPPSLPPSLLRFSQRSPS